MGVVEIAGAIISRAQLRVENSAQNIANMTTAGYKSRRNFSDVILDSQVELGALSSDPGKTSIDFAPGKLRNTGNPLDIAISGRGFFTVRSGTATLFTRDGEFTRNADGQLVTPGGAVLQAGGGDAAAGAGAMTVLADGTMMQGDQPAGRLAIADFADLSVLRPAGNGMFSAPAGAALDLPSPQLHQGMLETSNVSTADEMLSVMSALRGAESGQRVVQVYDDLMGRALTAFGQA